MNAGGGVAPGLARQYQRPAYEATQVWPAHIPANASRCVRVQGLRSLGVLCLGVDGVFGNFREDFVGFFFLFERLT